MQTGDNGGKSYLDFTYQAKRSFVHVVRDPYFRNNDFDLIYDLLKNKMKLVSFGDYLKRYIYDKAELSGPYLDIPTEDYLSIICDEFHDRQVPCSFSPTTTKLKNAAKNWLEQQTVGRSVVLLLGFGLGMGPDDVNGFLKKALQEPELDAKDPMEAICWFCYRNGLSYLRYEELWSKYLNAAGADVTSDLFLDKTISCRNHLMSVTDENELLIFLSTLPVAQGTRRQSLTAREHFDRLYLRTRELIAGILTESEMDSADKRAGRLEDRLSNSDSLYDHEKLLKIRTEKGKFTTYTADDIAPADIESVILSAVPKDRNGNLASMKGSALNRQFAGKRLTRQHLGEILSGKAPITRFDLITLNFFICSQEETESRKNRYSGFIDSTNRILDECAMGPLYVVNPYECFLLMCILSDDPLGTYSDVWEMSFDEA